MKKSVLIICLVIVVAAATGGYFYYQYQHKTENYPVALLENFVKSRLVSSGSYKLISVEKINKPCGERGFGDGSILVTLKFNSQNKLGVQVDGKAIATFISKADADKEAKLEISPLNEERWEKNKGKSPVIDIKDLRFFSIMISGTSLNRAETEWLNSGSWTDEKSVSVWSPPTPDIGAMNVYEHKRYSMYVHKLGEYVDKIEKIIAEKMEWNTDEKIALFKEIKGKLEESQRVIETKMETLISDMKIIALYGKGESAYTNELSEKHVNLIERLKEKSTYDFNDRQRAEQSMFGLRELEKVTIELEKVMIEKVPMSREEFLVLREKVEQARNNDLSGYKFTKEQQGQLADIVRRFAKVEYDYRNMGLQLGYIK